MHRERKFPMTITNLAAVFLELFNPPRINEKGNGLYRGFGYLSLVSDPLDLAIWSQKELPYF